MPGKSRQTGQTGGEGHPRTEASIRSHPYELPSTHASQAFRYAYLSLYTHML